ncbi:GD11485 [Drosophila simulans]|uniref:GD11485 n=1 Tax=Drosophila simulans TaxID=7240 RepID=B4QEI5_DROSI|nr:GD11485 [Drosophila simulans]
MSADVAPPDNLKKSTRNTVVLVVLVDPVVALRLAFPPDEWSWWNKTSLVEVFCQTGGHRTVPSFAGGHPVLSCTSHCAMGASIVEEAKKTRPADREPRIEDRGSTVDWSATRSNKKVI